VSWRTIGPTIDIRSLFDGRTPLSANSWKPPTISWNAST
jgi:hypothetical protein